mmetsp:Transcript_74396/g.204997  ORF Transcript_74396/g.204997 Transcript_74396/m.204997 type:complete len:82 (-) Transcript_74396:964-1209(-)
MWRARAVCVWGSPWEVGGYAATLPVNTHRDFWECYEYVCAARLQFESQTESQRRLRRGKLSRGSMARSGGHKKAEEAAARS